jgi:hypothetical protein
MTDQTMLQHISPNAVDEGHHSLFLNVERESQKLGHLTKTLCKDGKYSTVCSHWTVFVKRSGAISFLRGKSMHGLIFGLGGIAFLGEEGL